MRRSGIPSCAGLAVIGRSAERLRATLSVIAEHHEDRELAVITEFLAIATMLIAEEEGFADVFRIGDDGDDIGGLACRLGVMHAELVAWRP